MIDGFRQKLTGIAVSAQGQLIQPGGGFRRRKFRELPRAPVQ